MDKRFTLTRSTAAIRITLKVKELILSGVTKREAILEIYRILEHSRLCDTCMEFVPIDWPYEFCNLCLVGGLFDDLPESPSEWQNIPLDPEELEYAELDSIGVIDVLPAEEIK